MLNSIIIEGIDRLGKNTLISGIKNRLGFFQEIHYQKPEILDHYVKKARRVLDLPDDFDSEKVKYLTQKLYQQESFIDMMKLLSTDVPFIMNRAHLGESVYSHRYRGYSGDYVFNLEQNYPAFLDNTLLVLLHTSSFDFIKDDGLSFNFDKKDEEQMDFIRAFEKSQVKHKLLLDVNDGSGNFVAPEKLLEVVIHAFNELQTMSQQIMYTTWFKDSDGSLNRRNTLQPNTSRIVN
jgi:hypothetical protein